MTSRCFTFNFMNDYSDVAELHLPEDDLDFMKVSLWVHALLRGHELEFRSSRPRGLAWRGQPNPWGCAHVYAAGVNLVLGGAVYWRLNPTSNSTFLCPRERCISRRLFHFHQVRIAGRHPRFGVHRWDHYACFTAFSFMAFERAHADMHFSVTVV